VCIRSVDRHVLQTRGWHGDSSAVSMEVYDAACTVIHVSVKRGTGRAVARPASQCLSMGSQAICVRRARRGLPVRLPSHRISRAPPHSEAKQASVSPSAPATKGLGERWLHSRSLFQTTEATHHTVAHDDSVPSSLLQRAWATFILLPLAAYIHSLTHTHSFTRACTASPHSLLSNPAHCNSPTSPETPPHTSVSYSIHRVHILASTLLTRLSASRQPNYPTSTSR